MYRITAKETVTGVGYGLHFVEGVAETENVALAEKLHNKGYLVELIDESGMVEKPPNTSPQLPSVQLADISDLQAMGRAELDAYAATLGFSTKEAKNKEAAIGMILAKVAESGQTGSTQVPDFEAMEREELDAYAVTLGLDTREAKSKEEAIAIMQEWKRQDDSRK